MHQLLVLANQLLIISCASMVAHDNAVFRSRSCLADVLQIVLKTLSNTLVSKRIYVFLAFN